MNMFQPTTEEIESAKSGGRIPFKNGEKYTFMISEVKQTVDKEGMDRVILGTNIVGGEFDKKEHAFFFDSARPRSFEQWINVLREFFSEDELRGGKVQPTSLVGLTLSDVCKVSTGSDGNTYTNFYNLKKTVTTPDIGGASVGSADIPF